MARRKQRSSFDQVSEFDRGKIVAYRDCGLSFREIGGRVGRNQTTVMRICNRWMQEGTTDRRVRSHPPQCTTLRADRQIVHMVVTDRSVTSRTVAQHIQSVTHHSLSARTIRRRLQLSGLSARPSLLRLPVTQNHRRLRRQWCDERRMWTAEWNEIVFTDESRFCLQHHDDRRLPWPARSPDLSPIENMWSMVAQRLAQITFPAVTPDQLWQRVEAAWPSPGAISAHGKGAPNDAHTERRPKSFKTRVPRLRQPRKDGQLTASLDVSQWHPYGGQHAETPQHSLPSRRNEMEDSNSSSSNYSELPFYYQVPFLLNVTRDMPYQYAHPLFGYAMPILLVVTILSNTLVIIVLSQRHMRTPTNLVLIAMAISDVMTLLFPAPWYFYMYTLENSNHILYPPAACYAYHAMIESVPNFFHTASIWLTLLLAAQRFVYVCKPAVARVWCTVPRVSRAVIYVIILAFLHQASRFADPEFRPVQFRWRGGVHWGCQFLSAPWVRNIITENVYYMCYYGFRIIFVHIGPCTALVILNVCLFRALKAAEVKRGKLFLNKECRRMRDSNCTTLMLIVVVSVFLIVEIPLAVTSLLHVMQNAMEWLIADYEALNATILFTNFIIMLSYPVNFAIYCGMSRQFRETFKDLFIAGNMWNRREGSGKYSLVNGPRTSTNETIL
ncbi:SPR [Cordylochernes scorpioides]|uniref:SPR n=1 Tax=Cordylochernes scorpioides TaxID=51811 RepID=A0ABY6K278_9ARAC|nr:SPR [Cordylochernes scorpioides]